jgi:uncharacterized protein (TIGR03437 family)
MREIAQLLANRAGYDASGVTGVYTPGVNVVLTTVNAAVVPVTGACFQAACPSYGGQLQDSVTMAPNSTITLSLGASQGIALASVSVNPTAVVGGTSSTGTVTLSAVAPTGGIPVALSSNNSSATAPASIIVAAGSSTATFPVTTTVVASSTTATITASYNQVNKTAVLTIAPVVALTSMSLDPATVPGGSPSTGTAMLSGTAPTGGISVALSSDNSSATVPATINVAAGSSAAIFTVTTTPVASPATATITASYNQANKTAILTVIPAAVVPPVVNPAPVTITSVSPNSGPTSGGTSVTIRGTGFTGALAVTIGGAAATSVKVVSALTITAMTPAGTAGSTSVIVTTPNGNNGANTLYTYGEAAELPLPPLEISSLGPVSLEVVQNASLLTSGIATIAANQDGHSWQATTNTGWLALANTYGAFPGAVGMTANASGLAVGSHLGSISVTSEDKTLSVPVTLMVLPPASITVSSATLPSGFGYPVGSATGYDVQIGPAGVAFTAQTSADSKSWLSISPTSGIGPATIHLVIDPGKATYGTYQDALVITSAGAPNSPMAVPVKMAVSSFFPLLPQQVNGATMAGPDHTVAPNEIASLYLSDFSCPSQPVVSINGTAVAWSSYSSGQINYAVPATLPQQSVLSVSCNGATVWSFNGLSLAATIPGIFTPSGTGTGQAAARNSDGTSNGSGSAARRGSYVSVYVTGFGAFNSTSQDGLRRLAGAVTAELGGVPATVQYAGEAPGSTDGLQQINLLLPDAGPVGAAVPVTLSVNGTPTQATATIAVE